MLFLLCAEARGAIVDTEVSVDMRRSEPELIYVIYDDGAVATAIAATLETSGYQAPSFTQGADALARLKEDEPDLIIIDNDMSGMNGLELTGRIREVAQIPILILSVMTDPPIVVACLDRGADDYMTKPFIIEELAARVRALLRRAHRFGVETERRNYQYRGLTVDLEIGTIVSHCQVVALTPMEWSVLAVLVRNAGRVVTHRQILQEAWALDYREEHDYVRTYISRLRRKLGPNPSDPLYIISERGIGYRLVAPE